MRTVVFYILWLVVVMNQLDRFCWAANCTQLPKSIALDECCSVPPLLKQNALDSCKDVLNKGNQCFYECVYAATELCRQRSCDFRKVEDYIDWVWPNGHDFKSAYKCAFKECMAEVPKVEKKLEHKKFECDPKPELIELCVKNKMWSLCPTSYFNWTIAECKQEREFLESCLSDAPDV